MKGRTVSDQIDAGTTPDETEQGSVPDASSPPPWGDEFDAQRAWNTINHLRDRERELDSSHKALERLRGGDDLDTFRELAEAYGFELPEGEEEQGQDEDFFKDVPADDPYLPRIAEVAQKVDPVIEWVQDQQLEQALGAFNKHLDELAQGVSTEDAPFELDDDDRSLLLAASIQGGFNEKSTEAAFGKYKARIDARTRAEEAAEEKAQEAYKQSKKAPHVTSAGKPGTEVPSLDTHEDRMQWYRDQMAAGQ